MTHYKRQPLKVDFKESTLWALNSVNSVGVGAGPVGGSIALFDLANRETARAHRLAVYAGGASKGLPVSGSFKSWSDYAYFRTSKPVSFKDFDGAQVMLDSDSIGPYDWTTVSFPFSDDVKISGWSISIPGTSRMIGTAEVLYSDGQPLGDVTFEVQMPTPEPDPGPVRIVQMEDQRVYRLANDVLFDFDEYVLKTNPRTQDALVMLGSELSNTAPEFNFLVIGHTDSKGPADYNKRLSKHRAESVANWFIDHAYVKAERLRTLGRGFEDPVESNDTAAGRAANRRVEVIGLRVELWKSW